MIGSTIRLRELCRLQKISHGAAHSWVERGLIDLGSSPGKGSARHVNLEQATRIIAIAELVAAGLRVDGAARAVRSVTAEQFASSNWASLAGGAEAFRINLHIAYLREMAVDVMKTAGEP